MAAAKLPGAAAVIPGAQIPNNLFFPKVIKRHRVTSTICLVDQLNAREAADV